jgi:hypothetical protein
MYQGFCIRGRSYIIEQEKFIITGCLKFNAAVHPLEQNGSMKYFNLNRPLGITSSLKTHNATLSYAPSTVEVFPPPPPPRDGDNKDFV